MLYIGQTDKPKSRWSNHKSHIRCGRETCNLATHCIRQHSDTMVGEGMLQDSNVIKEYLEFTILDRACDQTPDTLSRLEEKWRYRLKA